MMPNKALHRGWLVFRFFNVVSFVHGYWFFNVHSRWSTSPVNLVVIRPINFYHYHGYCDGAFRCMRTRSASGIANWRTVKYEDIYLHDYATVPSEPGLSGPSGGPFCLISVGSTIHLVRGDSDEILACYFSLHSGKWLP